ncbi:hypothetical protein DSM106972_093420 [Dulcicalothrix desertica PCC 7102]|uniref:Uncharacterized protein n=1 Tax=Dulcicalothrix desertica PCC 7102 TaxID=232991 RepID=A0A433UKR9_9CYAN|nr:hypothetical protein [Dulcicalothrix desertica]RUS94447.1 hypothetical protein DSM106972_093420 [Dulcicalothrix desertica PCC 7102]TWH61398.1 hypothetical protein CAL7102_00958 [Dulcicalothrix desertica PCC 7102]
MSNALHEAAKRKFDSSFPGLTFEEKKLLELCSLYNQKVEALVKDFVKHPNGYNVKKKDYSISPKKFIGWEKKGKSYDRTTGHITYWVFRLKNFKKHQETLDYISKDNWKMLLQAENILHKISEP